MGSGFFTHGSHNRRALHDLLLPVLGSNVSVDRYIAAFDDGISRAVAASCRHAARVNADHVREFGRDHHPTSGRRLRR